MNLAKWIIVALVSLGLLAFVLFMIFKPRDKFMILTIYRNNKPIYQLKDDIQAKTNQGGSYSSAGTISEQVPGVVPGLYEVEPKDRRLYYPSHPIFMGVPVPQRALKITDGIAPRIGGPLPTPLTGMSYGMTPPGTGFVGSVDRTLSPPFPEVATPWEKAGLLTTLNPRDDTLLNLFRRPIAPGQDLWEYAVQDKDGFIVPFQNRITYLEDGDIIDSVLGKENKGRWRANIFSDNRYVWV